MSSCHQITAHPVNFKLEAIDYCPEPHRKTIKSLTRTKATSDSRCLHDFIVENCHKYPTKLTVRSFDGDLTYQDLDKLSLRLALHLNRLGVQPETFVLSSFQKSTWAIVARLAILRAGGAYISIHSSNPPAYLNSVIKRTGANIMLSDLGFAEQFRNTIETVIAVSPELLWALPLGPQSIGKPKVILQEHRSYASAIRDYAHNLGWNWIVDPKCPAKLMPIGAVGEIVIEGPHLSRGYLDQDHQGSDRTKPAGFLAEIPCWLEELHPDRQSTRLYQSGDLARWTPERRIEYIGQKDTIVKLNGCRIDVIEVENLARRSLTSKDAIVVGLLGVLDGKEDPCLPAFLYLSDHPENPETEELCLEDASQDRAA
ncbi:hypothetical protein N7447_002561 [Penicillium robsamsonii]|uniref:uncharacterized protein n=1 Tax=Penicillium robsamsonii TaxID=1792511 RepID=UPI002546D9BF|nr:uncharacterized protein N7447_002561 [Penicillium robsamsonii]KAJ5836535.1 hypothetical protein N7447_002561 [Penicillium robsamsonii]